MQTLLMELRFKLHELLHNTDGQDMVEYALVIAILCLGVTASSQFLSASLAKTFGNISGTVGSYVS